MAIYKCKRDGELCDMEVTSFEWTHDHNGIIISWISPQLGFGEYVLKFNEEKQELYIDSEHMDADDDLSFLAALLECIPKDIY